MTYAHWCYMHVRTITGATTNQRQVTDWGYSSRKTCLLQAKFFDTFWWLHGFACGIHQKMAKAAVEPGIPGRAVVLVVPGNPISNRTPWLVTWSLGTFSLAGIGFCWTLHKTRQDLKFWIAALPLSDTQPFKHVGCWACCTIISLACVFLWQYDQCPLA